ncbi:MAG: HepT-like ribonuclease domain-containing protein [Candidatus Nanopelagicales bacterium]
MVHARGTVNEEILLRAAERLLEIIGEAATNCSPALKDRRPDVDWEGIAGLRVVLGRHYHRLSREVRGFVGRAVVRRGGSRSPSWSARGCGSRGR